jgi:hypothetical protein
MIKTTKGNIEKRMNTVFQDQIISAGTNNTRYLNISFAINASAGAFTENETVNILIGRGKSHLFEADVLSCGIKDMTEVEQMSILRRFLAEVFCNSVCCTN